MNSFDWLAQITDSEIGRTEEDVKVKIVVKWLELLGHKGLKFEHAKNDIYISYQKGSIVVETKKLGVKLENYLDQVKRYAADRRAFLAILTNGQEFLVFSPFWRKRSFADTLVLSFSRDEINSSSIQQLLKDIMSEEAVSSGSAFNALEEREKFLDNLTNSIREEKHSLEHEKNLLASQIKTHQDKIVELETELRTVESKLTSLSEDILRQHNCWNSSSIEISQTIQSFVTKVSRKTYSHGDETLNQILDVAELVFTQRKSYSEAVNIIAEKKGINLSTVRDKCTRRIKLDTHQFNELLSNRKKLIEFLMQKYPHRKDLINERLR
ncbi:MAG: hypothetical protein Q7J55_01675 [bacterium]|nr:hypothetical protein [bacterium]